MYASLGNVCTTSLAGANATSIESPEGCGPRITFPSKWSKVSLKVRRATSTLLVLTLPHTHTLSSLHRPPESYRPVTSAPTLYYKPYSPCVIFFCVCWIMHFLILGPYTTSDHTRVCGGPCVCLHCQPGRSLFRYVRRVAASGSRGPVVSKAGVI